MSRVSWFAIFLLNVAGILGFAPVGVIFSIACKNFWPLIIAECAGLFIANAAWMSVR